MCHHVVLKELHLHLYTSKHGAKFSVCSNQVRHVPMYSQLDDKCGGLYCMNEELSLNEKLIKQMLEG